MIEYKTFCCELNQLFLGCADFIVRNITLKNASAAVFSLREMSDKNYISEKIIKPLMQYGDYLNFDGNFDAVLRTTGIKTIAFAKDAADALTKGNVVTVLDNGTTYIAVCPADVYFGRSVSEPSSDVTVKGAKSGFVEDIEKNICLLRKIIRSPLLKICEFTKGDITNTRIAIAYIDGRAEKRVIDLVKQKIENIKATVIVDSGNLEMLMRDCRYGIFPSSGSSEKIDKIASLLVSGRVAIICDGSPFVLTVPYVFAESLQSTEDYIRTPYYATFIRILRFVSLLVAVFLPSLFYLAVERYPLLLVKGLLDVIIKLRAEIPISLFWELVIMLAVFEMLREVGLRMPRTVGDAVGIVGSIIIGDAATEAGIASTSVILIVAVCAVSNFVVP
ncbi:MAG: spore germination protein, partial [Clostridia bacterium]